MCKFRFCVCKNTKLYIHNNDIISSLVIKTVVSKGNLQTCLSKEQKSNWISSNEMKWKYLFCLFFFASISTKLNTREIYPLYLYIKVHFVKHWRTLKTTFKINSYCLFVCLCIYLFYLWNLLSSFLFLSSFLCMMTGCWMTEKLEGWCKL